MTVAVPNPVAIPVWGASVQKVGLDVLQTHPTPRAFHSEPTLAF